MTRGDTTGRVIDSWQRLSLANRFAVAGGLVLVAATLIIGRWIVEQIETSVVTNSANATAHYMDSVLSPVSDQLAQDGDLSPGARRALDEIFANTAIGERVASFKIWGPDGTVIAASDKSIEGRSFPMTENLVSAWAGEVMADFEELNDEEDAGESLLGLPLLEIYTRIHEAWTGETAAVAEFYEVNTKLREDLDNARRGTWMTVAAVGLGLGSVLYVIVLGGSRTIDAQRKTLDRQLADLRELSSRNRELRMRVQSAAGRAATSTEGAMRRIGADLHDGPAQDLAFAALRLDSLASRIAQNDPQGQLSGEIAQIRNAVDNAMNEVRNLSRGLSLPDIAGRSLIEIVDRVVDAHRVRTGLAVAVSTAGFRLSDQSRLSDALRICLFRFIQEGLNNATRHGGGAELSVTLASDGAELRVSVQDAGPGLPADLRSGRSGDGERDNAGSHLGLAGLRDRIESLGGVLALGRSDLGGAKVTMVVDTGV